jgi:CelD/BcsL family acetyltransferase involved in cellulose biosynthesis
MTIDRRVLKSVSECEDLRQEWRGLFAKCRPVTPFHTYEWTKANLCTFGNEGVRVLVFSEGRAGVIAILPLVLRRGRRYLGIRSWLEFAGLPHADYAGVLVRTGYELPVAQSFLEFLESVDATWEGVSLDKLREDDEFLRSLLPAARERGWRVTSRRAASVKCLSKSEDLGGNSQGGKSKSLERSKKLLALGGDLRFQVYERKEAILEQLPTFVRLHMARFAAKGLQSSFASPRHVNFYRRFITECAPEGYIWLSRLSCGQIPVAMRLSLRSGETLHLYATCFAQEFAKYSPSVLQLGMLLEYAFEHGVTTVDFGIGESSHKQQAGATLQQQLVQVELYSNRVPWIESRSYEVVERACSKWPVSRRAGKVLRKIFPYGL